MRLLMVMHSEWCRPGRSGRPCIGSVAWQKSCHGYEREEVDRVDYEPGQEPDPVLSACLGSTIYRLPATTGTSPPLQTPSTLLESNEPSMYASQGKLV